MISASASASSLRIGSTSGPSAKPEDKGAIYVAEDLAHTYLPKVRLHDTIKDLNRRQSLSVVHFHGDGTGRRVGWALR